MSIRVIRGQYFTFSRLRLLNFSAFVVGPANGKVHATRTPIDASTRFCVPSQIGLQARRNCCRKITFFFLGQFEQIGVFHRNRAGILPIFPKQKYG
jgi:hypothetical protein